MKIIRPIAAKINVIHMRIDNSFFKTSSSLSQVIWLQKPTDWSLTACDVFQWPFQYLTGFSSPYFF